MVIKIHQKIQLKSIITYDYLIRFDTVKIILLLPQLF